MILEGSYWDRERDRSRICRGCLPLHNKVNCLGLLIHVCPIIESGDRYKYIISKGEQMEQYRAQVYLPIWANSDMLLWSGSDSFTYLINHHLPALCITKTKGSLGREGKKTPILVQAVLSSVVTNRHNHNHQEDRCMGLAHSRQS